MFQRIKHLGSYGDNGESRCRRYTNCEILLLLFAVWCLDRKCLHYLTVGAIFIIDVDWTHLILIKNLYSKKATADQLGNICEKEKKSPSIPQKNPSLLKELRSVSQIAKSLLLNGTHRRIGHRWTEEGGKGKTRRLKVLMK